MRFLISKVPEFASFLVLAEFGVPPFYHEYNIVIVAYMELRPNLPFYNSTLTNYKLISKQMK